MDERPTGRGGLICLGALDLIVGVVAGFLLKTIGVSPVLWLGVGAVGVLVGIVVIAIGWSLRMVSQEALELTAQLEALRRWLRDFTRLEEAVPQDVILWDRLLVMAVVLGVADEVIKQLKVVMPQVLEDPRIRGTYVWCTPHARIGTPAGNFTRSYSSAHSVSTAALAKSSDSSGGGGGGGFSGGGGGGFGGGGGGGAF